MTVAAGIRDRLIYGIPVNILLTTKERSPRAVHVNTPVDGRWLSFTGLLGGDRNVPVQRWERQRFTIMWEE